MDHPNIIAEIKLHSSHFSSETLQLSAKGVNVFIGPNGGGKSLLLGAVYGALHRSHNNQLPRVITSYMCTEPRLIWNLFKKHSVKLGPNADRHFVLTTVNEVRTIPCKNVTDQSMNNLKNVLAESVLKLDPNLRLGLNHLQTSSLDETPKKLSTRWFQDSSLRETVQNMVYEAIGLYPVLNPRTSPTVAFQLSKEKLSPVDEMSLAPGVWERTKDAMYLYQTSAGTQAYVGAIIHILANPGKVITIDEPEGFLHPSLARLLGRQIAKISREYGTQFFIATHSEHFLMGCLEATHNISITYLSFDGQKGKATRLSSEDLQRFRKRPILRSTGTISGLFRQSVVLVEGMTDRIFYEECSRRLAENNEGAGVGRAYFITGGGKSSLYEILSPLRRMTVPAAIILDKDFLKKEKDYRRILNAARIREANVKGLLRHIEEYRDKGQNEDDFRDIASRLAEYGIFIVPNGAVESWLPQLGIQTKKEQWVSKILEAMGEDRSNPKYLEPDTKDVWNFLRDIDAWLLNPKRKGTS